MVTKLQDPSKGEGSGGWRSPAEPVKCLEGKTWGHGDRDPWAEADQADSQPTLHEATERSIFELGNIIVII